jgi:hypothetical protein
MRAVQDYVGWILGSPEAASIARGLLWAAMPGRVAALAADVLRNMTCTPRSEPPPPLLPRVRGTGVSPGPGVGPEPGYQIQVSGPGPVGRCWARARCWARSPCAGREARPVRGGQRAAGLSNRAGPACASARGVARRGRRARQPGGRVSPPGEASPAPHPARPSGRAPHTPSRAPAARGGAPPRSSRPVAQPAIRRERHAPPSPDGRPGGRARHMRNADADSERRGWARNEGDPNEGDRKETRKEGAGRKGACVGTFDSGARERGRESEGERRKKRQGDRDREIE